MSLYDRATAPRDDEPVPPPPLLQPAETVSRSRVAPAKPPLQLRRLHRELSRLHVRAGERALVGDYAHDDDDDDGLVRKSGRIRDRERLSFSGFEKMKPLFLYDASFMLNDDTNRTRRRKVTSSLRHFVIFLLDRPCYVVDFVML